MHEVLQSWTQAVLREGGIWWSRGRADYQKWETKHSKPELEPAYQTEFKEKLTWSYRFEPNEQNVKPKTF